ncbi:ABC transporter family protein [Cryptosporidium muris RN66]|uniref:ABC transporter family protein n=1 Tax=Cryptosporidium muris (strain RN66) TaxID=441375 RepID=B6AFV5_CRYMR|nr:ABC transporter family protein [Cryptosporidium muris RN66]EEA07096.1 ABC transporter family protein [Cryptosporidium muris RN66]|eukprot:XP_002141445.1 ABC transporter family protein [Cryptosporidium muris RN66]
MTYKNKSVVSKERSSECLGFFTTQSTCIEESDDPSITKTLVKSNNNTIDYLSKLQQINYAKNQGFIGSFKLIWILCIEYFKSNGYCHKNCKKIRKLKLPIYRLGYVVILLIASSTLSYLFSKMLIQFWRALEQKNKEDFQRALVLYMLVLIGNALIHVIKIDILSRLQADLRMWITEKFLDQYYFDNTCYQFAIKKTLDNPDQRIGEDVALFASYLLHLICRSIDNFFDFLVHSVVLYKINISLFTVSLLYSAIGTYISVKLGSDIILAKVEERNIESNFRYSIVRVRENAENVAMYGGWDYELSNHKDILLKITDALVNRRKLETKQGFFNIIFQFLIKIIPIVVISPDYFSGAITMGEINQGSSASRNIIDDISILVNTFGEISTIFSSVDRIGHFISLLAKEYVDTVSAKIGESIIKETEDKEINLSVLQIEDKFYNLLEKSVDKFLFKYPENILLNSVRKPYFVIVKQNDGSKHIGISGRIRSLIWDKDYLKVDNIDLYTPDFSRQVFSGVSFCINPGEKILISGESGVGKSSLFRAINGIWFNGSGSIYKPPSYKILFVPQKPYCTIATLRDQLLYPLKLDSFLYNNTFKNINDIDSYLVDILDKVGLSYIKSRIQDTDDGNFLDVVKDWSITLSLGEQQRLAFARILIFSPSICLLDEATSALDVGTEAKLYSLLYKRPDLTYISISHRPTIQKYHEKELIMKNNCGVHLEYITQ